MVSTDYTLGRQGAWFNVDTLASGQTRGFVLNTWPKTGVDTPCTPAHNGVFTQCSHSVHAAVSATQASTEQFVDSLATQRHKPKSL